MIRSAGIAQSGQHPPHTSAVAAGYPGRPLVTIGGAMALVAIAAWFFAEPRLEGYLGVHLEHPNPVRAALVVASVAAVAFVVAALNVVPSARGKPFDIQVPPSWEPWIRIAAALAVGLLIGTTIFR